MKPIKVEYPPSWKTINRAYKGRKIDYREIKTFGTVSFDEANNTILIEYQDRKPVSMSYFDCSVTILLDEESHIGKISGIRGEAVMSEDTTSVRYNHVKVSSSNYQRLHEMLKPAIID